jgi:hypothetical protein
MITDKEKLRELDLLFEFANPEELKMDVVYLMMNCIAYDTILNEEEIKKMGQNIFYLISFLERIQGKMKNN